MRRQTIGTRLRMKLATRVTLRRRRLALTSGCLSICFDDVPRTAWTAGGPILDRHGVRATYYLNGQTCGGELDGREQHRPEDVPQIAAAGHEIGSHLFTHLSVLDLPAARLAHEIDENDRFLAGILGPRFRAESFAYPYGDMSLTAKRLCGRRFQSCRSVLFGLNAGTVDADMLTMIPLDRVGKNGFDWDEVIARAARDKAWIIALAHGVDDTGHPYSCSPAALDRVVTRAKAAGLSLQPVGDVFAAATAAPEELAAMDAAT